MENRMQLADNKKNSQKVLESNGNNKRNHKSPPHKRTEITEFIKLFVEFFLLNKKFEFSFQ